MIEMVLKWYSQKVHELKFKENCILQPVASENLHFRITINSTLPVKFEREFETVKAQVEAEV